MSTVLRNISFAFILLIGFAGPFLGYSIYLFISLGFLLLSFQSNYSKYSLTILTKDFFFLGLFLVGVITNNDNYNQFFQRVLYPWLITIIFQNIVISEKHIKTILLLFGAAILFQVFKMTVYDLNGNINLDFNRLLKFSQNEFYLTKEESIPTTYYGTYVALLYIVLFLLFNLDNSFTIFKTLLLVIVIVLNILASKRAYWFALLIFSFLVIYFQSKTYKIYLRYILILLIFIVFILIISPYLKFIDTSDLVYRLESFVNSNKAEESMAIRYYRWGLAMNLFFNHPFGVGFNYFFDTFHIGTTHNEYLAYGLGYGYFGLLFYILILISYYKIILRNFHNSFYYLKLLGLGLLIFIIIIGFTENFSFSNLSFNLYTWVILGLQGNPIVYKNLNKK